MCVEEDCGKCSLNKFKLKRHTLRVHLVGSAAFGWDPEYTRNFEDEIGKGEGGSDLLMLLSSSSTSPSCVTAELLLEVVWIAKLKVLKLEFGINWV